MTTLRKMLAGVAYGLKWAIGVVGVTLVAAAAIIAIAAVIISLGVFCAVAIVAAAGCAVVAIAGCLVGAAVGLPAIGLIPAQTIIEIVTEARKPS